MPKADPKRESIAKLADEAERLAPTLDLVRFPDRHIHLALENEGYKKFTDRKPLIGPIKAELRRRRDAKPFSEREDLKEDARRLEAGHPQEPDEEDAN